MRARRPALLAPILAVAVLTAGCSGDDPQPATKPTATASPTASGLPAGTPVPELLSGVRCNPDDDGVWAAVGVVSNPTKNPVSYQVSAQVGPADGAGPATTRRLVDVAAGTKVRFRLDEIPTSSPDGPCHLQLLALQPD
ncbi:MULTISPECIES: hypothetical protein [unclassified Aeromicrobium]|uniref:hypothetical protein n=1 Tax=unclassified Aeromicrobium TaxID=2633570 RepID=UPI0006FF65E1|nr:MULTISPECIES: hypothetical protein [unclassified Aeromicrobium]KQO36435.1 hypothetical protein ASF05_09655 [Aeromicrobium sp. Leaf245]KQP84054.1 hypothetical protein ASF35_03690 [Aeromicrobium sp. Leaf291]